MSCDCGQASDLVKAELIAIRGYFYLKIKRLQLLSVPELFLIFAESRVSHLVEKSWNLLLQILKL